MKKMSGDMWQNGRKTELCEILAKVPENDWEWYIYELYAVSKPACTLNLPEFEKEILSLKHGYKLSWREFKKLALELEDVDTCLACALPKETAYELAWSENFSDFFAKIDIFDSASWEITLNLV